MVSQVQPVFPQSILRDMFQEPSVFSVWEFRARSPQGYRKVFVEKVYEFSNICSYFLTFHPFCSCWVILVWFSQAARFQYSLIYFFALSDIQFCCTDLK